MARYPQKARLVTRKQLAKQSDGKLIVHFLGRLTSSSLFAQRMREGWSNRSGRMYLSDYQRMTRWGHEYFYRFSDHPHAKRCISRIHDQAYSNYVSLAKGWMFFRNYWECRWERSRKWNESYQANMQQS